MHIHPNIKPNVDTNCSASLFTPMVSVDAAARVTGLSEHAICARNSASGVRLHQCCGIDYVPGHLVLRALIKGPARLSPQEALEKATTELAAMSDNMIRRTDRPKMKKAIRAALAMAAALNDREFGREYDISEGLALAFRPDLTQSQASKGESGRQARR